MPRNLTHFHHSSGCIGLGNNAQFHERSSNKHKYCFDLALNHIQRMDNNIQTYFDVAAGSGKTYLLVKKRWPKIRAWLNDWDKVAFELLKVNYPEAKITQLDLSAPIKLKETMDLIWVDFNTFTLLKSNIYCWDNLRNFYERSKWLAFCDTACYAFHLNKKSYGFESLEAYYRELARLITGKSENLYCVYYHKDSSVVVVGHAKFDSFLKRVTKIGGFQF